MRECREYILDENWISCVHIKKTPSLWFVGLVCSLIVAIVVVLVVVLFLFACRVFLSHSSVFVCFVSVLRSIFNVFFFFFFLQVVCYKC